MPFAAHRGVALFAATLFAVPCLVRADAYDPTATYYNNATGTGTTLKSSLYSIISVGNVIRTYGDARYAESITDRDPNNSNNILLTYNRASINGTWDQGATWNREHVWPKSLLNLTSAQVSNSYSGIASDQFELHPANPDINSSRSNYGYGKYGSAKPAAGYGIVSSGGTFFYPGDADSGDVSRAIFYMATRYGQGQANNLTLVNGAPSTYQMGDLNSLLHWNYSDPVDDFERKRNQTIYSSALNPTYYQGNRNPFVDHPEYVWAIWGTSANNSKLSVGTATTDGTTTTDVDLGNVIVGSAFSTRTLSLAKTGTTPTTFDATVTGNVTSTISGPRKTFEYDPSSKSFTVALTGGTAAVGDRAGSVVFNNTDLTTAGAGTGSADGNDTVNVHGRVVTHAQPSASSVASATNITLDLGIVARNSTAIGGSVSVSNLGTANAYVAGLDVDSLNLTGDTDAFSYVDGGTNPIAVGSSRSIAITASTTTLGQHLATLTAAVSDENIPGATSLGSLTYTLQSRVAIGGDATLDNSVNFDDLIKVAQNYNGTDTIWQTGDFTRDGNTNFDDLIILAQNYNTSASAVASLGSDFANDWALARALVPEPTSLMAIAGASMLFTRRRRH